MIIYLLVFIFLFFLFYYTIFLQNILRGLKKIKPVKVVENIPEFVSVIIPFRNESENILKSLNSIESQAYPADKYEVIYVDDSSDDDSFEKLCKNKINNNIRIISLKSTDSVSAHKKRAVKYGIDNSKGEIIVTTDADCIHSKLWLKNLLSTFEEAVGFVSGPVKFISDESLFSKIQSIEFSGLVLTGAGLIGNNSPSICNGANVAYRKNVFYEVNGFEDHLHLSSGDDEILMQKIAAEKKYKVVFCINEEAVVSTQPNKNIYQFYQQRKRWASKSLFYPDKNLRVQLILIFIFYFSLIIQMILTLLYSFYFVIPLTLSLITKTVFEYLIIREGKGLLTSNEFFGVFLISEIFHIPYIIISALAGIRGKFNWKKRNLKR
jgi:cellulose synthase/poly-beta-1,6-N-acetylglucosamine synthase-like glycosyltransferase